jgi:tetratricopeptide (TPR) repeat protein
LGVALRTKILLPCLALILFSLPAFSADRDSVRERALSLLRQGEVKRAIQFVHTELGKNPKKVPLRMLLGQIVDFDGKPEAAIRIWKEGVSGQAADFPLLMSIAERRRMQSEEGPTVEHKRGSVTYNPSKDEAAEKAFKERNAKRALDHYGKARALRPKAPEIVAHMGQLQHATGQFKDAIRTWSEGAAAFPKEDEFQLGWAKALGALKRPSEASEHYQATLALNSRRTEAHEALADYYETQSMPDKSDLARQRAAFYGWIPGHIDLEYTPERFALAKTLNPRLPGGAVSDGNRAAEKAARRATIANLKRDKSTQASALLATLCYQHEDHGPVEDAIYAELKTRGEVGERHLIELLKRGQSNCTARSASHALADAGNAEILPRLLEMLAQDNRPYFHMDIAGALRKLGDERAVVGLVKILNAGIDEKKPSSKVDPMDHFTGRLMNRKRCAAALGGFDTEAARKALETGAENPQLAMVCSTALYEITREASRLAPVRTGLKKNPTYGLGLALGILKEVETPEARELVLAIESKMKKERNR